MERLVLRRAKMTLALARCWRPFHRMASCLAAADEALRAQAHYDARLRYERQPDDPDRAGDQRYARRARVQRGTGGYSADVDEYLRLRDRQPRRRHLDRRERVAHGRY